MVNFDEHLKAGVPGIDELMAAVEKVIVVVVVVENDNNYLVK